jgi:hypothetical protein
MGKQVAPACTFVKEDGWMSERKVRVIALGLGLELELGLGLG